MHIIFLLKKKLGLLHVRLHMIYSRYSKMSEYEKNEATIKEVETVIEIERLKKKINELELNFISEIER